MSCRIAGSALRAILATGAALALGSAPATGQVPWPHIPDTNHRSGLLTRFVPIVPHLPPDPKRDTFYDTRWADKPAGPHVNCPLDGGLYGRRWPGDCTACVAPFFRGSLGRSTLGPGCQPGHKAGRLVRNFLHPFDPIGSYYAGGCYVPIYDLDPTVTGPGAFPWPHFFRRPTGG